MADLSDAFEASREETTPLLKGPTRPVKRRASFLRFCCIGCLSTLLALVLAICVILVLLHIVDLRNKVPDIRSSLGGPGVGIDLTPSYATLAVHEDNISTGVVRLPYDNDWVEMMKKKSDRKYFSDPWRDYCSDPWGSYSWKNIWRRIRRRLGLPSTPDVARLSDIISQLETAAAPHVNTTITYAVFTAPMFPQLCPDHFTEAARLNKIASISLGWRVQLRELSAAYAAYGLGLCRHYLNRSLCEEEERAMPLSRILSISHTKDALVTDFYYYGMRGLRHEDPQMLTYSTNWTLGAQHAPPPDLQESEAYWKSVGEAIEKVMMTFQNMAHVDKVLLFGESVDISALTSIVRDTVLKHQDDLPIFYDSDTLYIAARGAATLAKRETEKALRD